MAISTVRDYCPGPGASPDGQSRDTASIAMVRRTAFGVVADVLGLALLVGAGLALTSGGGTKVGDNTVVEAQGLIDVRNSPTIVHNPTRAGNLVTTYRMDRPGYSAFLSWSDNGGASWEQTDLPLP